MNNHLRHTSCPGVYLTPLIEEHIDRYIRLSDDPGLVSTMGWRPFAAGERERFLQVAEVLTLPYCRSGSPRTFSIIASDGDVPVGFVTIKGINEDKSSAELGIAIMEREYRGCGYGTEALKLAVNYARNEMGLSLLGLTVFPDNHRAIRAYERVGFKKQCVLEKSWRMPDGGYVDMVLMEIVLKKANTLE